MNKLFRLIKRNSPKILTFVSIALSAAACLYSAKGTTKAEELKERERPGTASEKLSIYVRSYWPAGACLFGSATLSVLSNKASENILASVIAAAGIAESRFNSYRQVVREKYGKEKEQELYMEVVDDDWGITPPLPSKTEDYDNHEVFYDAYSERYFVSSVEKVQQAMYHLNRNFAMRGYAFLNEYYDMLGIEKIPEGDSVGWEAGDLMDGGLNPWIDFYADVKKADENAPKHTCIIFDVDPTVEAIERATC